MNLVWQNRSGCLYHGDSLALMAEMAPESIDCIWTDPPYNLSNGGTTCKSGTRAGVNKGEWDRSRGILADHEFNLRWLEMCHHLLKPSGTIWVSGTIHVYPSVGFALQTLGFRILNDIIWEKPAPPPNLGCRCFTHATEVILWAVKDQSGKYPYTFNYEKMKEENNGKQMKNVWRFNPPTKEEKIFGKHPTQKPISLIERCLKASTNAHDMVFDPFCGSGSTGVAALNLDRRFIGCEQNEDYVKLSIDRLMSLDHQK